MQSDRVVFNPGLNHLDYHSFCKDAVFPSSVNLDKEYEKAANVADKIFENKSSYPVFDLRAALIAMNQEDTVIKEELAPNTQDSVQESIVQRPAVEDKPVSNRIKGLQCGIKLPMPGGAMPTRQVKPIQVEKPDERSQDDKAGLSHLTKGRAAFPTRRPPNRKLSTCGN